MRRFWLWLIFACTLAWSYLLWQLLSWSALNDIDASASAATFRSPRPSAVPERLLNLLQRPAGQRRRAAVTAGRPAAPSRVVPLSDATDDASFVATDDDGER